MAAPSIPIISRFSKCDADYDSISYVNVRNEYGGVFKPGGSVYNDNNIINTSFYERNTVNT